MWNVTDVTNVLAVCGENGGGDIGLPITAGLEARFDGSQLSGGEGSSIETWPDLSGNGNDAVQLTVSAQPTLRLGVQNGRSVVRFDGTDDRLENNTMGRPANYTIFSVINSTGVGRWLFGQSVAGGSVSSWGGSQHKTTIQLGYTFGDDTDFSNGNAAVSAISGAFLQTKQYTTGQTQEAVWVDGVSATISPTATGASSVGVVPAPFGIGSLGSFGNSLLQGDFAELVIYNRVLTTEEREATEAYLQAKWATPALP